MYQNILSALERWPAPYESTGTAFWDDEHISASMLGAHLDPDADGASRRSLFIEKSAAWIGSLCPQTGALLDLGCGPGLYAQRFFDQGYRVTGVDISRRSIAYAQAQAERSGKAITYRCMDYLSLEYSGEFDLTALIYCDFGVLPPSVRALLLQKIHDALRPGGLLVLDVFSSAQYQGFCDEDTITHAQEGFWSAVPHVCIKRQKVYPAGDYLEHYTVITQENCTSYNLWNHAFTGEELRQELAAAGFTGTALYGDAAGAAYSPESATICAVCAKPA